MTVMVMVTAMVRMMNKPECEATSAVRVVAQREELAEGSGGSTCDKLIYQQYNDIIFVQCHSLCSSSFQYVNVLFGIDNYQSGWLTATPCP